METKEGFFSLYKKNLKKTEASLILTQTKGIILLIFFVWKEWFQCQLYMIHFPPTSMWDFIFISCCLKASKSTNLEVKNRHEFGFVHEKSKHYFCNVFKCWTQICIFSGRSIISKTLYYCQSHEKLLDNVSLNDMENNTITPTVIACFLGTLCWG